MNFKKILGITLSMAVVCVGFAGCRKSDSSSNTEANEQTAAQKAEQTTEQTTQANVSFEKGTKSDSEYVNESLGLKFTLPDGYKFLTDEEISQIMGQGADALLDSNNAEALKNAASSRLNYEMAAASSSGENVNMIVENLGTTIDEKTYADIVKKQYETMINAKITNKDDGKLNLAGMEFYDLSHDIEVNGLKRSQKQLIKSFDKKI